MPSDFKIRVLILYKKRSPFLAKYDTKVIVNVCGKSKEDYIDVVERLADTDIDMLEMNVSCPNVKRGRNCIWSECRKSLYDITQAVKKVAKAAGDHEAQSECYRYY